MKRESEVFYSKMSVRFNCVREVCSGSVFGTFVRDVCSISVFRKCIRRVFIPELSSKAL